MVDLVSSVGPVEPPPDPTRPVVCFLCTGNAARSVMAAAMLARLTDAVDIRSAGTHVIEGQPPSVRVRRALERHGLSAPWHRSRQMGLDQVEGADLIVAMEPDNVAWLRRTHPEGAARTGTLIRLARELEPGPAPLAQRVAALGLAAVEVGSDEEVVDPAAGDQAAYDRCADELAPLVAELARRL
ncbi:MAG: hypothetical protein D6683_18080 [Actinomyces sp.]|nr:MAG: hypothetical protein D6683_18080 [Actinomyces sp.]